MNVSGTKGSSRVISRYALFGVCLTILLVSASPLSSQVPRTIECQTAEECFRHALRAGTHSGHSSETLQYQITRLQTVQSQFPGTIWAKRAGVHLGRLLKASEPAAAVGYFQTALSEFPILDDYLHFWLGESLILAGQPQKAAVYLEKVASRTAQSRLQKSSLYLAGRAWRESGDCPSAVRLYRQALKLKGNSPDDPHALLEIGKCEAENKNFDSAREAFREIWWRFPTKPEAKSAQQHLTQLPPEAYRGPTHKEQYKRALSYFKAAAFEEAVSGLQQYLQHVLKGKQYDDVQYKLGMSYVRLKQYHKAEGVFRKLTVPQSHREGDAYIWLARSYLRQGKGAPLLALQQKAKSRKISGDRQALIHVFSGVWLSDHGKQEKAIQAFEQASKVARSSSRRQDALWRISLMYYQRQDYPRVVSTLKRLLRVAKVGEKKSAAQYWLARTYEHLQQSIQAQRTFLELSENLPFTYYGQLAQSRLEVPVTKRNPAPAQTILVRDRDGVSADLLNNRRYQKAVELVALELFEEAQDELSALRKRTLSKQKNVSHLISMAHRAGAYDFGIRLAIRHFGYKLRKAEIPLTSDLWLGAYPTGYVSTIQRYAPSQVDPYLVAGLIREESLYDARAMSQVGARGLMQLMPKTADRVANRIGTKTPEDEELFDAEVNIQLGTNYVGELLNQFNGNVVHAVAAYNAGPAAVKRWIAQYPNVRSDEFVERIAYRETRRYVKRVLGSYWIYRGLTASPCQTASLDRVC